MSSASCFCFSCCCCIWSSSWSFCRWRRMNSCCFWSSIRWTCSPSDDGATVPRTFSVGLDRGSKLAVLADCCSNACCFSALALASRNLGLTWMVVDCWGSLAMTGQAGSSAFTLVSRPNSFLLGKISAHVWRSLNSCIRIFSSPFSKTLQKLETTFWVNRAR
uniref:Putative secreted protein n=1 Tax=Ixodes ricinus TaxID=34613 RepID=A0A6B0UWR6_IXORI